MNDFAVAIVLCSCFGYGFWLGWWARSQKLTGQQRLIEALAKGRYVHQKEHPDGTSTVTVRTTVNQ